MNEYDEKVFNADLDYASSDHEAENRYLNYGKIDPLTHIQPALLNSADIAEYVSKTGMIYPFRPEQLSKPASYALLLKGRCIYWDETGKKQDFILSNQKIPEYNGHPHRKEFTLARNSIAFVTLEPSIRLPDYIAVRFNLTIQEVYRGLLLGTGPLVDPGFQGKLSLPLHNLTNNEYTYRAGDELVWMEFTKLSKWHEWFPDEDASKEKAREGEYVYFPGEKLLREDVASYLEHATGGDAVRSSIPGVLEDAKKEMKQLKDIAIGSIVAFSVAVLAIVITLVVGGVDMITQINTRIQTTSEFAANALAEVRELRGQIKTGIRTEIKDDVVAELATTLDALKKEQTRLESDSRGETNATRERISQLMSEIEVLTERILAIESNTNRPAN